ncbi:hypothetical protein C8F04DRAFT_1238815 [Mycena alexandri]|uniref:Uncharacterized protein n=1 Tax=Mycena alexandri TaxID=1745969 RepID=A0AAD6SIF8_9AGAR|nr:hypothetical protein C8F04DRAFT_1238815 [Mycena alexandri]
MASTRPSATPIRAMTTPPRSTAAPPIPPPSALCIPLAKSYFKDVWHGASSLLLSLGVALLAGMDRCVVLVRKAYLTVTHTTTPSPFLVLQKSFLVPGPLRTRTFHALQAHVLGALAVLAVHAALDPAIPVFIRSRRHPYTPHPSLFLLATTQVLFAAFYAVRATLRDAGVWPFAFSRCSPTPTPAALLAPPFLALFALPPRWSSCGWGRGEEGKAGAREQTQTDGGRIAEVWGMCAGGVQLGRSEGRTALRTTRRCIHRPRSDEGGDGGRAGAAAVHADVGRVDLHSFAGNLSMLECGASGACARRDSDGCQGIAALSSCAHASSDEVTQTDIGGCIAEAWAGAGWDTSTVRTRERGEDVVGGAHTDVGSDEGGGDADVTFECGLSGARLARLWRAHGETRRGIVALSGCDRACVPSKVAR